MLLSSAVFYIFLLVWSFVSTVEINEINHPTVGVIRWDAWNTINGEYDVISNRSRIWFNPQRYHYRLPFFAKVISDNNITMNEDTQEVMDREIIYAKLAGFDYWAFDTYCTYTSNCSTNSSFCAEYLKDIAPNYCVLNPAYGLNRYLSSQHVNLINFTVVLLGSTICDNELQKYYIELMTHPQFQTVLGGRPLLYLFQFEDKQAQFCGDGWQGAKQVFDNFRQKVIERGLKNPYMVLMDGDILVAKNHSQAIGFDAISSYGLNGGGTVEGAPFSDEIQRSKPWWQYSIQSGAKVVIPLSTGWDPRPQSHNGTATHFLQPTAEELQNFVKDAIQITCQNKDVTEAQTVLVYAWNECAENGAALIPSLGNGTYFVNALSQILPMSC